MLYILSVSIYRVVFRPSKLQGTRPSTTSLPVFPDLTLPEGIHLRVLEIDRPVSRPVKAGVFLEGEQGDFPPVLCQKVAYQGEASTFLPPLGTHELPDECFGLVGSEEVIVVKAVRSLM